MIVNKLIIIVISVGILPFLSHAQSIEEGKVSFITSENVYIRFNSTKPISIGDTLFFKEVPCFKVIRKSSTSCICQKINACFVQKDDPIVFRKTNVIKEPKLTTEEKDSTQLVTRPEQIQEEYTLNDDDRITPPQFKQRLKARTSISTYSTLSQLENKDKHRMVGRASMNIDHINNSRFSIQSYLNYRQNLESDSGSSSVNNQLIRVYNLALSYDVDSTIQLSVGRKINRNLSSIGVIDGLQFEKQIKTFITGAVVGFRPDFQDFGFNPNLFEYGAFIGNQFSSESIYSRTTLGFLEQRNSGKIDRRYFHVQNIQTFNRKLHLFGSMEFDLYNKINGISSHELRLTNIYLSTRYRFNRKLSLTISYDNRKRIIYYATFRTEVERLLDDDIARQGIRVRINARPMKQVFAGVSYSKRFQTNSENKSDNINAFVTISRFLISDGSLSIRYNINKSNYLSSTIFSTTFSFYSFKNKLNTQLYYRNVQYDYFASENKSTQNYYGTNLYLRITRSLRFGLLFEISEKQNINSYRINTKLIKRFNKK